MATERVVQLILYLEKSNADCDLDSDLFKKIEYISLKHDYVCLSDLLTICSKTLNEWKFTCQSQLYFIKQHNQKLCEQITPFSKFTLTSLSINSKGQFIFPVAIRSMVKVMQQELLKLRRQVNSLTQEVKQLRSFHQHQLKSTDSLFQLHQSKSSQNVKSTEMNAKQAKQFDQIDMNMYRKFSMISNPSRTPFDLDLGFLFSEPIYDPQSNLGNAGPPVGYRSEIKRIKGSIKAGSVGMVNIKCQRATLPNLIHMINNENPAIIHISCHGESDGKLNFQQDSLEKLGQIRKVSDDQIIKFLKPFKQKLPKLSFVNTCYSQKFGRALLSLGVQNVIAINSKSPINDQAAEVFSQHFYKMIFKGGFSISQAFQSSKNQVRSQKFDDNRLCCCYHETDHDNDCFWVSLNQYDTYEAHNLYHMPPAKQCQCPRKYFNEHLTNCTWARKTLFTINKKFRVYQEDSEKIPSRQQMKELGLVQINKETKQQFLVICCGCKVKQQLPPHGESKKFMLLSNNSSNQAFYRVQKGVGIVNQINDFTAQQFLETNQNLPKNLMGRQTDLYQFFKTLKNNLGQRVFTLTGAPGSGKSIFINKAGAYMLQRKDIQSYFYINLYRVDDEKIFKHKFYETTRIQLGNQDQLQSYKFKKLFIALDNVDFFVKNRNLQFFQRINQMKRKLKAIKIVLIMQDQTYTASFDGYLLQNQNFKLGPLGVYQAAKIIFLKLKTKLFYKIKFPDILSLVEKKKELRYPRIIDNYCQSFNSSRQITRAKLEDKITQIIDKELTAKQLIQKNLLELKQKFPQSYELFLFISQFAEGLSLNDIYFFSQYPAITNQMKKFPIRSKQWMEDLEKLGDNLKVQQQQPARFKKNKSQLAEKVWKVSMTDSYFLNKTDQDKVVAKKYLRQYIWFEHTDKVNFEMKFLYICYVYVMLQVMFNIYKKQHFVHQEEFSPSALSENGIFQIKTDLSSTYGQQRNITRSISIGHNTEKLLKKVIFSNQSFIQKIHIKNPTDFIENHKQQFINFYIMNFQQVFDYLIKTQNSRYKIYICYLENLLVSIPTALMIANSQLPFQEYIIGKSLDLLGKIRTFLFEKKKNMINQLNIKSNYLVTFMKLNLMKISVLLKQKTHVNSAQIDSIFDKMDSIIASSSSNSAKQIRLFQLKAFQKQYTELYRQKICVSNKRDIIKKVNHQLSQFQIRPRQVLKSKYCLILVSIFLQFYKEYAQMSIEFIQADKVHVQNALKAAKMSWKVLENHHRLKLALRLRCCYLSLLWINITKMKQNVNKSQLFNSINQFKNILQQSKQIFKNKQYKLRGFSQFQICIHEFKTNLAQKIWLLSKNTMVFMRGSPIYKGKQEILVNLVRKSHNFRRQIEAVFKEDISQANISTKLQDQTTKDDNQFQMIIQESLKSINSNNSSYSNKETPQNISKDVRQKSISVKFQVLTREKFRNQSKLGISILVLTTDFKQINENLFMVIQNQLMQQSLIPVDQAFIKQFDLNLIKILIIFGQLSFKFVARIKQLMEVPPLMICFSYEKTHSFYTGKKQNQQAFINAVQLKDCRNQMQILYIKLLISKLKCQKIKKTSELLDIHKEAISIVRNRPQTDIKMRPIFQSQKSENIQLNFTDNTFKNLSADVSNFYNVQLYSKQEDTFYILRRKQQIRKVLSYASKQMYANDVAYINLFGQRKTGKTYFAEQLVRIFLERQFYSGGVFMIRGKVVEQKYHGNLEKYIEQKSLTGHLPNLEYFMKCEQRKIMFIIDDYNLITPKSRVQFDYCFEKIKRLGINLLIVTNAPFKNQDKFPNIYRVKLSKISTKQFNILTSNTIKYQDKQIVKSIMSLHKAKSCSLQKLQEIKSPSPETSKQRQKSNQQKPILQKYSMNQQTKAKNNEALPFPFWLFNTKSDSSPYKLSKNYSKNQFKPSAQEKQKNNFTLHQIKQK